MDGGAGIKQWPSAPLVTSSLQNFPLTQNLVHQLETMLFNENLRRRKNQVWKVLKRGEEKTGKNSMLSRTNVCCQENGLTLFQAMSIMPCLRYIKYRIRRGRRDMIDSSDRHGKHWLCGKKTLAIIGCGIFW